MSIELVNKYCSVLQHKVLLTDTQNLIGEVGRGSGKTTEMFAPRIVRVSYSMPRSTMLLVAPTYAFIMDTIIPGIITYLGKHYTRGIEYEYGKEPPKHFLRPITPVGRYKHSLSFAWGTTLLWGSLDRPESIVGKNVVHVFADELLRIDETDFVERVVPTLREDRELYGHSHYFGGITGFSSTPNFENDNDWWLKYAENVNQAAIDEIENMAFDVLQAQGQLLYAENDLEEYQKEGNEFKIGSTTKKIKRLSGYIARQSAKLSEKRHSESGKWAYIKGSSFSNLAILGLDYIKRQFSGARSNFDKFKLSILGIRPERVKEMFFANFGKGHIFKDSYVYHTDSKNNVLETIGERRRNSSDLKYCDPTKPLIFGYDPGNFMSLVVAQERPHELRIIKNFYVWTPKQHFDLAAELTEFFKPHERRSIELYYDRAANQRKELYANNPKGKTDIAIFKRCLEDLGWRVELRTPFDQRTIEHWEHYLLIDVLLTERQKNTPRLRFCQFEAEELISSIYMSPIKREKGSGIELDKSSEKKLNYDDQPWYSTQLPSALMYMLFGKYEKYKPEGMKNSFDIPGL